MKQLREIWARSGRQIRRLAGFLAAALVIGFGVEWFATSNARMVYIQPSPINDLALSPDGALLAVAYANGTVEIRETDHSRRLIREFHDPSAPVVQLDLDLPGAYPFAVDGTPVRLTMARADGTLKMELARTGQPLSDGLTFPTSFLAPDFRLTSDGVLWATGFDDGGPWIAQHLPNETLAQHVGMGANSSADIDLIGATSDRAHVLTPDAHLIWGPSENNDPTVLSLPLEIKVRLPRRENYVALQDGRVMALQNETWSLVGDGDETALETSSSELVLRGHTQAIESVDISPDGSLILTASNDNTAKLWTADGAEVLTLEGHEDSLYFASFSPDGTEILTASVDGSVRLWAVNGTWVDEYADFSQTVNSAVFSPDGQQILAASNDGTAILMTRDGIPLVTYNGHTNTVRSAVFSPDGTQILTASTDETAILWDLEGNQLATLAGHTNTVWGARFSPDGQRIITAGNDGTARIWDLEGNQVGLLEGHSGWVNSAFYSPDGTRIVTASLDGTARIWDPSGREIAQVEGYDGNGVGAALAPDGSFLVAPTSDGTATIWREVLPDQWVIARSGSDCLSEDGEAVLEAFSPETPRTLWMWSQTEGLCGLSFEEQLLTWYVDIPDDTTAVGLPVADDTGAVYSILAGRADGSVVHRKLFEDQPRAVYHGHGGPITQIESVMVDRRHRVAIAAADGSVQILDLPFADASLFARANSALSGAVSGVNAMRVGAINTIAPLADQDETGDQALFNFDRSQFAVVIDASHGGQDPGGIGSDGTLEKDLVFDLSQRLVDELTERGYRTRMTRTDDTFIALRERSQIAADFEADLFLSLHADAATDTATSGSSIYTLSARGAEVLGEESGLTPDQIAEQARLSGLLSTAMLEALSPVVPPIRNPQREAAFLHLRIPRESANVNIELGFVSNEADLALLNSEQGKTDIVAALTSGVERYARDRYAEASWQQLTGAVVAPVLPQETETDVAQETEDDLQNEAEPIVSEAPEPVAQTTFSYYPPGDLMPGTGTGRPDETVYAPDIIFPIRNAPAFINSQIYRQGGAIGGDQCEPSNYQYPWRDNYCETRSSRRNGSLCPDLASKQSISIRAGTAEECNLLRQTPAAERGLHEVVAVADGIITSIGSYSVTLRSFDDMQFTYRHLNMQRLNVNLDDVVTAGDLIGYVSNDFGGTPTTLKLDFEIRMNVEGEGLVRVPPYMSLVRAYERRDGITGQRVSDAEPEVTTEEVIVEGGPDLPQSTESPAPIIYIHYNAATQADAVPRLVNLLTSSGFDAPLIDAPEQAPSSPQLRYFRPGDEQIARLVADQIAIDVDLPRFEPVFLPGYEASAEINSGHLEIWFPRETTLPTSSRLTPRGGDTAISPRQIQDADITDADSDEPLSAD